MASSGSDDNEWQPPTEAEMKLLAARRERSDKISQIMGQYLLKGYRMLGTNCTECECIMMQDKQKRNYCIACEELDTDTDKDDPAVSQTAARSLVEERRSQRTPQQSASPEPVPTPMDESIDSTSAGMLRSLDNDRGTQDNINANLTFTRAFKPTSLQPSNRLPRCDAVDAVRLPAGQESSCPSSSIVETAYPLRVLNARMIAATRDLETSVSTETSIQLCMLIKSCAESIAALHRLHVATPAI